MILYLSRSRANNLENFVCSPSAFCVPTLAFWVVVVTVTSLKEDFEQTVGR